MWLRVSTLLVLGGAWLAACGGEPFRGQQAGPEQGGETGAGGTRTAGGADADDEPMQAGGTESSEGGVGSASSAHAGAGGEKEQPAAPSIVFVAADELNVNGKNFSLPVPPSVAEGDLLLLFFSMNGVEHSVSEPSGVGGWTLLEEAATLGTRTLVWSKRAAAEDAGRDVTVALSDYNKSVLTIAGYRGEGLRIVAHASRVYADPVAAYTTPQLPNQPGGWLVSYFSHKSGSATGWQPPTTATVRSQTVGDGLGRMTTLLIDSNGPLVEPTLGGISAGIDDTSAQATLWSLVLGSGSDYTGSRLKRSGGSDL